jgi:ubiquitin conjugation factor E4 B
MRSGLILQQYSLLLKGFKEKLLLMSSPANITQLIEELVSKKQEQLQAMKEEWKFRENLIMKELSQKVPALVEIPNEFIDIITGTPMTDPYMDEHGHTCDKATWEQTIKETGKNPFNRAPMTLSEIFPNEEMKKKILDFQQKNPDVWKRGI